LKNSPPVAGCGQQSVIFFKQRIKRQEGVTPSDIAIYRNVCYEVM
jgi:hypothetical protein